MAGRARDDGGDGEVQQSDPCQDPTGKADAMEEYGQHDGHCQQGAEGSGETKEAASEHRPEWNAGSMQAASNSLLGAAGEHVVERNPINEQAGLFGAAGDTVVDCKATNDNSGPFESVDAEGDARQAGPRLASAAGVMNKPKEKAAADVRGAGACEEDVQQYGHCQDGASEAMEEPREKAAADKELGVERSSAGTVENQVVG